MSEENTFYQKSKIYWANIPPTVNGVLGGFGHISNIDIDGSRKFLDEIFALKDPPGNKLALDCGAGIGRITKNLLIDKFDKVDLVEQDERFVNEALSSIGANNPKLGNVYKAGLQYFEPIKKYDVIWIQWVLGHLNDDDMCGFLQRCRLALNKDGIIVVKENITADEDLDFDDEDSSVTRPIQLMEKIFRVAKLSLIRTSVQEGFPEELYAVHLFALRPTLDYDD